MMPKIPFQKIDLARVTTANKSYWAAKDLMRELIRKMPQRIRKDVWIEVDKEMGDRPTTDLPRVFQNCAGVEFPWTLKLHTGNAIQFAQLVLNEKLRESPIWRLLGEALVESTETCGRVLVLFKLYRLGLYVAHNMPPPTDRPYVCVPAQVQGNNNIIIEPFNQWAERNLKDV